MLRCAPFALFAGLMVLAAMPGRADEKRSEPAKKAMDEAPADPDALSFQQAQLPKTGVNYKAIANFKPLANATDNRDEWEAYQAVIAHVSQVPLTALKRHRRDGVDPKALYDPPEGFHDLLAIKGRLVELQRVETRNARTKVTFEGWVWVYTDGNEFYPMRIALTELPEGFTLSETVDEPIAFEGYFFKVANYSGEKMAGRAAPKVAPLVIGRSFRLVDVTPPPPNPQLSEAEQIALQPEFFTFVKDKDRLASRSENYEEFLAYTHVFEKVMQFSPEVLARNARRDIVYADLINEIRREYLRKLLHVEGRLVRVRKRDARDYLKIDNLDYVYEGWILHDNVREHPIVVAFTELPEGMEVGEKISHNVAADGYYFKLMAYMAQEKDDKGKDVWRVAPLLVARKPIVLRNEREQNSLTGVVPLVLGSIGVVAVAAIVLTWWYRRGDRRTRERVRATMFCANPFEAPPPAVQPGTAWGGVTEPPASS